MKLKQFISKYNAPAGVGVALFNESSFKSPFAIVKVSDLKENSEPLSNHLVDVWYWSPDANMICVHLKKES